MAYMNNCLCVPQGPYPSSVGDFCGNTLKSSLTIAKDGVTILERASLSRFGFETTTGLRIGRPSNCPAGTSEEMLANGYVGLYLTEEKTLGPHEVAVDTDVMQEEVVSGQRKARKPLIIGG